MANNKRIIPLIILLLTVTANAYKPTEGNVTATLGYHWFKTNLEKTDTSPTSPFDGGLGLIASGDVNDTGAIEIGVFPMNKRFFRRVGTSYLGEKTELIHISMGYRWWLNKVFSIGLAFYSSYTIGSVHTFQNDLPAGLNIKTSAQDITEYGFDFSLQSEIWSDGLYGVTLNGIYSYSATKKTHEFGDHYGIFLGLRYLIQTKSADLKGSRRPTRR